MHWKIKSYGLVLLLLVACTKPRDATTPEVQPKVVSYYSTRHLIEAEDLMRLTKDTSIKIIDFRRNKHYQADHIVGAINLWRSDIESEQYPFGGMMASKLEMEDLLGKIGLNDNDQVVVYDGVGSCDAARLWWVLKSYGLSNVQILNGGIDAWKKIKGSTDSLLPIPNRSSFKFSSSPLSSSIESEELLSYLNSPGKILLLDTRSIDEFSGKRQKKGATSGGRIPGAIHIDWAENVNSDEDGKFKSYKQLAGLYDPLVQSADHQIVTYCQTGVRSSLTYFVLTELLGYKNVKNYDGSWSEWSYKNLPKLQDSVTVVME
ncbi:MAG: rhodanese-like domain-containing protein [Cyclobacteriaceae bacterium]